MTQRMLLARSRTGLPAIQFFQADFHDFSGWADGQFIHDMDVRWPFIRGKTINRPRRQSSMTEGAVRCRLDIGDDFLVILDALADYRHQHDTRHFRQDSLHFGRINVKTASDNNFLAAADNI